MLKRDTLKYLLELVNKEIEGFLFYGLEHDRELVHLRAAKAELESQVKTGTKRSELIMI
jgi:hypothetical protein